MATIYSNPSQVSMKSHLLLEEVAKKSTTKLAKLTGIFDDEDLRTGWNAFGLYISRQLRQGRAVMVGQFGLFTFTAPDVTLTGVSNPWERDKQYRNPVFIIGKDFANGLTMKSGIYQGGNIRPYKVHGLNGRIAQTKINYTEVGIYSNKTRDQAQQSVARVIRQIADDAKSKGSVDMEIPNVGVFRIRSQVAAVQFNSFLQKDAKANTHNFKSISDKKMKIQSNLTSETVKRFENYKNMSDCMREYGDDYLEIDNNARDFLRQSLAIDVNSMTSPSKQPTKLVRPFSSSNRYSKSKANGWASQSQLSRPLTTQHRSSYGRLLPQRNKAENDIAFRKLKFWMRSQCLNPEDAFTEFVKVTFGKASKTVKITTEQLFNGIQNLGIPIDPVGLQELHRILDFNKDGLVDKQDWITVLQEPNNAYLQKIKDVIAKYRLQSEDILLTMKLSKEDKSINLVELYKALQKLDTSLNDSKAVSAAKALLKNSEFIDALDIIEELGCDSDDQQIDEALNYVEPNWFNSFMKRLYQKLQYSQNPNILKEQFETADIENSGRLHATKMKTCLINCQLGFTVTEMNRIVRFMQVDQNEFVDFYDFLKELNNIGKQVEASEQQQQNQKENNNNNDDGQQPYFRDFKDFIEKLKEFLKRNQISSPEILYNRILETLNISELKLRQFTTFLFRKGFPKSNEEEIEEYAQRVDIDNDGIISIEDMKTFYTRLDYIQNNNIFLKQNNFMQTNQSTLRNTPDNPKLEPRLYPDLQLEDRELSDLIRELKSKLYLKKLSFYDFFKRIDLNQDGFITIDEWTDNLEKCIGKTYPKHRIDGLFSYFDIKKIGMIDYKTFLRALNADTDHLGDEGVKQDDDWEWTQNILGRIKEWFNIESVQIEDAFRVMDKNFDGYIGKSDIESYLKEVLHISPKEITPDRINRIFKLLDEFKRGQVVLSDLKRLLVEKNTEKNQNFAVTGGKFTAGRDSFDWRLNAKQQLGIVLSRKFLSLKESFEEIAQHKDKIIYKNFEEWVQSSRALIGFDLSNYQIQQVFSDIDPHKKGYLTERDWVASFSGFSWKNQMLMEIQETMMTHFQKKEDAFKFFSRGHPTMITEEAFSESIRALFQQRFSSTDICTLWKQLNKNGLIDLINFVNIYDDSKGHKKLGAVDKPIGSQRPQTSQAIKDQTKSFLQAIHKTPQEEYMDKECIKIVRKVKSVLRASNKSIQQIFQEFDSDGSGELSNIEFKNAFRSIGIGLTSKEIDYLLNYCDESGDGFINWHEFVSKFKLGDAQTRIVDRSKSRLQHINDNIHYYMLSPKDAFRLFNQDRTGQMNYQDFTTFMQKLCLMANEQLPAFAILKDIFQTIDIRKDGVVDMTEWIQTFKQFQPPNASMQGRPNLNTLENRPQTTDNFMRSTKQKEQSDPFAYHIEASQVYDKIMQVIGRNRKFLLQTFNDINKQKVVTFTIAKDVIEKLLMSVGIKLQKDHYPLLLKFAERDGIVDYRFMLEVYKERIQRISQQPDPKLM